MPNTILTERSGRSNIINHFICDENKEVFERCKKYLAGKSGNVGNSPWNSRYFDKTTNIEITDPWKAAIRICAKRIMSVPSDIIIDFMVTNGLWDEE